MPLPRVPRTVWGLGVGLWVGLLVLATARSVDAGPAWGLRLMPAPGDAVRVETARAEGIGWLRGIRPGDQVLRVGDLDPSAFIGQDLPPVRDLTFQRSTGAPLTTHADGPDSSIWVLLLAGALLFTVLGLAVFRWSADARFGALYLTFSASFASALLAAPASLMGHPWATAVASVSAVIAVSAFAGVFVSFPRPLPHARAVMRVAVSIAGVLATALLFLRYFGQPDPPVMEAVLSLWMAGNLLGGLGVLITRLGRRDDRQALMPVVFGVVVGVVPLALLQAIPRGIGEPPPLRPEVAAIGTAAIPIGFAYAILRHRLFALEARIRRIVVQAIVVGAALVVFLVLWVGLGNGGLHDRAAGVVAMLVTAMLLPRLARHLQRLVDAWLYGPLVLAGEGLDGLREATDAGSVGRVAARRVRELVPTRWAACVLREASAKGEWDAWRCIGADGEPPAAIGGAVSGRGRIDLDRVTGAAHAFAIRQSGASIGSLLVGPRLDGTPLTPMDLEVVATLALRVATPLELVLLRERTAEEAQFRVELTGLVKDLAALASADEVLRITTDFAARALTAESATAWRGGAVDGFSRLTSSHTDAVPPDAARTLEEVVGPRAAEWLRTHPVTRLASDPSIAQPDAEHGPSLALALGDPSHAVGLCVVRRHPTDPAFTEVDERRAAEIAGHASGALRRAVERERSQEHLAQLRRRQELILTSASEGIVGFDPQGVITFANPAAERLLGFAPGELAGRHLDDAFAHPEASTAPGGRAAIPIRDTLREGTAWNGSDAVLWRRDGQSFPVEYQSDPIYEHGSLAGAVLTFSDITARRASERSKDEFVSLVSHELRTPLNGVIGFTELLLLTKLDRHQREHVSGIKRAGGTLLSIVNDILDLAKIDSGQIDFQDNDVDVRALVDDVVALLREQAHAQGLELAAIVHRSIPARLRGDAGHLRQVLLNLVSNAIKFTDVGEVLIRAKLLGESPEGVVVHFEVQDTGIGIDPAAQDRLFLPFLQADSSSTRKYGGTGLGLTICKRTVEAMGGEIGVDSEPGHGSRFWFTVRLHQGVPMEAASPARPRGQLKGVRQRRNRRVGARVLVVDDSIVGQQVTTGMLKYLGYDVDVAENGVAALQATERQAYDVILMDCRMPEMDGFAATATLRRREGSSRHTPIVALTAHARESDRERCFAAGMDHYLAKPIRLDELANVVSSCLAATVQQRAVPERAAKRRVPRAPSPRHSGPLAHVRFLDQPAQGNLAAELAALYLEETSAHLATMLEAVQRHDTDAVKALAHTIAGDSAILHVDEVQAPCREIQRLDPDAHPRELRALVRQATEGFERARTDLAALHMPVSVEDGPEPAA